MISPICSAVKEPISSEAWDEKRRRPPAAREEENGPCIDRLTGSNKSLLKAIKVNKKSRIDLQMAQDGFETIN